MDEQQVKRESLTALRGVLETLCPLTDDTWEQLASFCLLRHISKHQYFTREGDIPSSVAFVYQGLWRAYVVNVKGKEYNKVFFAENALMGSMAALLTQSPSHFSLQALEDSWILQIDFKSYRHLLKAKEDLKWFYILYLEKSWVITSEQRELALVQNDATERYLSFRESYAALEERIPQFHIASHLGITPTQLSRVRKNLEI